MSSIACILAADASHAWHGQLVLLQVQSITTVAAPYPAIALTYKM
jgi:hypothetical protein